MAALAAGLLCAHTVADVIGPLKDRTGLGALAPIRDPEAHSRRHDGGDHGAELGSLPVADTKNRLLMYVYDLEAAGVSTHCTDQTGNYGYESHVEEELRHVVNVTKDPNQATFFLLPACLTQFMVENCWRWRPDGQLTLVPDLCMAYESNLTRAMRHVGNFFDRHGGADHLVTALKCPLKKAQGWSASNHHWFGGAYPTLWRDSCTRNVCLETENDKHARKRDLTREVHVPYYVPPENVHPPLPPSERDKDLFFVGSYCCGREWLKRTMRPDDQLELFRTEDQTVSSWESKMAEGFERQRRARLLVSPHGDSAERIGFYQGVASGTPLLLTESPAPPLRLANWNGIAVDPGDGETFNPEISDKAHETDLVSNRAVSETLRNYSAFLEVFTTKRGVLLWRRPQFRLRLRRVLMAVFPWSIPGREMELQQQSCKIGNDFREFASKAWLNAIAHPTAWWPRQHLHNTSYLAKRFQWYGLVLPQWWPKQVSSSTLSDSQRDRPASFRVSRTVPV